ncbi:MULTISPECIES: CaiB/BaiF CoA transferase family protein [Bradyrhizobium]|jgi:crotonobetainyl-CoA:carnitine CoA-transferase CaiB-like acyl-CoA transferase|uniref:Crotonobetainyl-CoA:carnitine CoA-transferase CaiB n=2 Tax=Bradyrhizobium TaxID=374 RepID=A0ABY0PUP0_9BRAD|nr:MULTISPECIES: CoA transferase [Bradyrhizobium]SDI92584.1 Crotonobetainyl-CoA:carnitine CoA-transferase CaiB [Bradyrhizobium ottawaense]SED08014.1 Crotonobetainyl-CoA:carnitine CoA-transferase CaiB [Bradyrhizobium lablabi]SHL14359.1 Crotonobetainyl-CoA:carnitine CoA-transferase CaiB [Bradyrhizobium lablabi]
MNQSTGPLAGIQVLDLTSVLFGPYAAQTLGDWGAEVIKVEPLTGDTWRYAGQFRTRGMSGQFMATNRNKRSLALDLKHPDGKAVLQRLIAKADVLVTNIRPAALARLGFGYEDCQQLNPRMVYAAATGFGQDGPWAARPAFDEIIQASSGFASSMGTDEEPVFVPSLVGDKICGLVLTAAISAALVHRERSGRGQMVEIPMLETIAAFNSIEMLGGHAFVPPIGPAGYKRVKERRPIRTKDGWLTMLPYSGDNWCSFFETVGHPECIEDFAVRDPVARAQNIDRIYQKMAEIALTRTTAEWEALLLRIDVPHAAFAKVTEIAEQPHLKAVGMFPTLDHPTEGEIRQARPSARFSESPAAIRRMPPRLGEHSQAVLQEAGLSDEDIASLVERKVVGIPA